MNTPDRQSRRSIQMDYGMPSVGGAYGPPPYTYERAEELVISFITDADAVRALLPAGLVPTEPARGIMRFVRHAFSPFGPYSGAYLSVSVLRGSERAVFMLMGLKNEFSGTVAGRELWGMPLKTGRVEMSWSGEELRCNAARGEGDPLCAASAVIGAQVEASDGQQDAPAALFLRNIPSPEPDSPADRALVRVVTTVPKPMASHPQQFAARCTLDLSGSASDPWNVIPVEEVRGGRYTRGGGILLGYGRVVERL